MHATVSVPLPQHNKTRTPKPYRFGVYEVRLTRVAESEPQTDTFNDPSAVARALYPLMEPYGLLHERFVVVALNTANRPIGYFEVTVGTVNTSLVHPREIFQRAILANATSIIVAHNHPAQTLEPSPEDLAITHQLVEAGKILGIRVLDHLIIATDKKQYTSLAERGQI